LELLSHPDNGGRAVTGDLCALLPALAGRVDEYLRRKFTGRVPEVVKLHASGHHNIIALRLFFHADIALPPIPTEFPAESSVRFFCLNLKHMDE